MDCFDGALNRFNGKTVKRFTHIRGDSTSPLPSVCYAMACGTDGRLWIAFWDALVEFDYESSSFRRIKIADGININTIVPVAEDKVYFSTRSGLRCYNPIANRFEELAMPGDSSTKKLLDKSPAYHAIYKNGLLYIATKKGYIIYNPADKKATFYPVKELSERNVNKIMVDKKGSIWLSNYGGFKLLRIDAVSGKTEVLDNLLLVYQKETQGLALDFIEGNNNDIWIFTFLKGLLHYDTETKQLVQYKNDIRVEGSLLSNLLSTAYVSKDGNIWIGTTLGLNYFNPRKNLFTIRYPFADSFSHTLSRGIEEDHEGNLWFTTGNGISKYNVKTGKYNVWQNQPGKPNQIYLNSARGIAEDANHDIWVATGGGINRLNKATGKMDFLTIKDSIPQAFYFSLNKTSDGTLWFGTRDYDGLYYYKPSEKKFHSIANHPVLGKYKGNAGRCVFVDSKKRIWIGYNATGLVMYDQVKGTTHWWKSTDKGTNTIIGDVVVSIVEDKDGMIWISTFNGITCIDPEKEKFTSYTEENGLKSNIIGGIAVDDSNRLWFGTGAGLVMLDKSRQHFTHFGKEDGLHITDFNEHFAFTLSTGEIMIPSNQGYVMFNPHNYKTDTNSIHCFIAGIEISGSPVADMQGINKNGKLNLKPEDNFFTIELEALNFSNSAQTWYAYKLDGLEKNWHYTQDPKAVYTSVPGGSYTFRYKTSANANNWNVEEKILQVYIGTVFYKAGWFWLLIGFLMIALLVFFYRFRMNKQKQIYSLETKAESLEKEKTMVQYESLKQHLNPHFLFNSLTSLRSLIKSDSKTAASFLDGMSKVYRYVLKSGEQELVRLQDELEFVKTFTELQKIRFKEGLEISINIDASYYNKYIAPVTLQNLVENAIKHNTADSESPLVIDIFIENDFVVVRNNLQRYRIVETSNKRGLASLQTLYRYYSDKPIVIVEDEKFFTVKIPLL
jgi:ligand-binding sensor domain-containing protein